MGARRGGTRGSCGARGGTAESSGCAVRAARRWGLRASGAESHGDAISAFDDGIDYSGYFAGESGRGIEPQRIPYADGRGVGSGGGVQYVAAADRADSADIQQRRVAGAAQASHLGLLSSPIIERT